jgi:Glycosyl transferase family 2
MPTTKYSVIVPTRNRAMTLRHCLRTCLEIDYADYEIIVHDNYSTDETPQVVAQFHSPRLKYYRTDRPLSMTWNWEQAVARASGEWIVFIGDDDGLLPYTFEQADRIIERTGMRVVQWPPAYYVWPNPAVPASSDFLQIPLQRECEIVNARTIFKQIHDSPGLVFGRLGGCYHGFVHRSVLQQCQTIAGSVFVGHNPDIYNALSAAFVAGEYAYVRFPISIVGHSPKSNGGIGLANQKAKCEENTWGEFYALSRADGLEFHPWIGQIRTGESMLYEPLLLVQDRFYPNDTDLHLDRKRLLEKIVGFFRPKDPQDWIRLQQQIRDNVSDEPTLWPWVDQLLASKKCSDFVKFEEYVLPKGTGVGPTGLCLDASRFGVDNVYAASCLCERILCLQGNRFELNVTQPARPPEAPLPPAEPGRLDRLGLPRPIVRLTRKVLSLLGKKY